MKPMAVAAGYRHVHIPKSGRTFPAFLVRLPPLDRGFGPAGSAGRAVPEEAAESDLYRWRSKLDFLLLARAVSSSSAARRRRRRPSDEGEGSREDGHGPCPPPQFPKSAYAKLSDAAAAREGWVRPPLADGDFTEEDRLVAMERLRPEGGAAASGNNSPAGDCAGGGKEEDVADGYDARMKKSLHQIDSFLRGARNVYDEARRRADEEAGVGASAASGDEAVIAAWRRFCRDGDVDGLVHPPKSGSEEAVGVKTRLDGACEPLDRNAARLGQYFASDENARKVVNAAIGRIDQCLLSESKVEEDQISDWRRIVFVEPSCGDGRVLTCLIDTLQSSGKVPHAILGYDIDPSAVAACRDRIGASGDPKNGEKGGKTAPLRIRQLDFLELTKNDLRSDVARCSEDASSGGEGQKSSPSSTSDLRYIFVGGPPYSTGPGDGNAIRRDLPASFTRHCIVLGADVVVFLLPSRCASDEKMSCEALNRKERSRMEGGDESSNGGRVGSWRCMTEKLDDSVFHFRGNAVTQPSVVSSWFREKE